MVTTLILLYPTGTLRALFGIDNNPIRRFTRTLAFLCPHGQLLAASRLMSLFATFKTECMATIASHILNSPTKHYFIATWRRTKAVRLRLVDVVTKQMLVVYPP